MDRPANTERDAEEETRRRVEGSVHVIKEKGTPVVVKTSVSCSIYDSFVFFCYGFVVAVFCSPFKNI